jgi:mannose-6-phosphate isomerase
MLYPLRFHPIFKHYLWGGARLATLLGKPVPPGQTCAESWEIVDRRQSGVGGEQSIVQFGPLAGTPLCELVDRHAVELLGVHASQERFPLLVKLLDAAATLSVQVHPDDARARRLVPPDLGKTEAWVVLHAEPQARIYAGLAPGVNRQIVRDELARGSCDGWLHSFTPQVGDCVFLPAGLVHALGAGLVVVEIQQSSDVTYRLHDWNRVGPDGRPRALHVEQALQCLDDSLGPGGPCTPRPTGEPHVERLVQCDKFILDRWRFSSEKHLRGDARAHIVVVLQGEASLEGDPAGLPVSRGQTALIPACAGDLRLIPRGETVLLDAYLP